MSRHPRSKLPSSRLPAQAHSFGNLRRGPVGTEIFRRFKPSGIQIHLMLRPFAFIFQMFSAGVQRVRIVFNIAPSVRKQIYRTTTNKNKHDLGLLLALRKLVVSVAAVSLSTWVLEIGVRTPFFSHGSFCWRHLEP